MQPSSAFSDQTLCNSVIVDLLYSKWIILLDYIKFDDD